MIAGRLPDGWQWKRLGQVALVNPEEKSTLSDGSEVGFVSMSAIDETAGLIREVATQPYSIVRSGKTRFRVGDILFAKITPCVENGKIALVDDLPSEIGFGSTEFYVVRPSRHLMGKYLVQYLRTDEVRQAASEAMTGTTGRQRVPSSFMASLQVPVPPLTEQKEIVRILEQTDRLLQLRAEANRLAEQILHALFTETFGDPATNPMGWPVKQLRELLVLNQGGTWGSPPTAKNRGLPILRSTNMRNSVLSLDEVEYRVVPERTWVKYRLEDGDILVSKSSGSPHLVGRSVLFRGPGDGQTYLFSNFTQQLRVDHSVVLPEYLFYFLNSRHTFLVLQRIQNTSSGLRNLNVEEFSAQNVPAPPLPLQREFQKAVHGFDTKRKEQTEAEEQAQKLRHSILSHAFTGELTAGWRVSNSDLCIPEPILTRRQEVVIALLDELAEQRRQEVLLTQTMKYLFLTQMQGEKPRGRQAINNRLYQFEPYHYGPFARELYADLKELEQERIIETEWRPKAAKPKDEFMLIRLTKGGREVARRIASHLDEGLRNTMRAVVTEFGHLSHNELLERVYQLYPRFAKKALRKRLIKT